MKIRACKFYNMSFIDVMNQKHYAIYLSKGVIDFLRLNEFFKDKLKNNA